MLDTVVQAVLTDQNADIDALLDARPTADVQAHRIDRDGLTTMRTAAGLAAAAA